MTSLIACDVIALGDVNPESLLIVETFADRLQAGTIYYKDDLEIVTIPGTYLSKDIGIVKIEESWNPERAAIALAGGLFEVNSNLFNKYVGIWLDHITDAINSNLPFVIKD